MQQLPNKKRDVKLSAKFAIDEINKRHNEYQTR
jgi:hypothetical protein